MAELPKIYAFISSKFGPEAGEGISDRRLASPDDGDCTVTAVAEDGTVLAGHYSSSEWWARHDIGIGSEWKHDKYKAHYPDGYELVWEEPPPAVEEAARAISERS